MADPATPHAAPARRHLDRMGVVISGLCMVHCVAGLVLVSLLGLGGGVLLDPAIHHVGLALAVVIGALTLGMGALRHGHALPVALGGTGLALMSAALFVDHGTGEALLTIAGVSLVASGHIVNIRRHTR